MKFHPPKQRPPAFFSLFAERFLECSPRTAFDLWNALYPSPTLIFQLERCNAPGAPVEAIMRFVQLLSPKDLLDATARLARETGQRRPKDIIKLENSILERTNKEGNWT